MPISKKPGESKDDFIPRCISEEISSGREPDQAAAICYAKWDEFSGTQSVTDNTWSTESPISIGMESYSDYPQSVKNNAKSVLDYVETNGWGSCGTPVGKVRANQLANGEPISVDTIQRMYSYLSRHEVDLEKSKSYSDGCGKLMYDSWGGLSAKSWAESKLKELGLIQLASMNFAKVRRVIFSEDFNEDVIREYKKAGFKVHILSKRKVQRKDRKTYNKLKSVGLSEDNLLFGDIKTLDKKYNFDIMLHDTEDPILNALLVRGEDISKKKVISSKEITNMTEALQSIESLKDIDMKFVTIRVVFTYELRDDVTGPSELPTTRDFCKRVLGANKAWTIDEINSLPTSHLSKMGLPTDIFAFRGGFYTTKGGQRGVDTTPFCRHIWKSKVIRD
jgi:hypothetical protein